jgi:predicted nicotinamide N-methyase
MLPAEKKRGTSVRQWLPYRDGNRLTKVILGDVEVVLAKQNESRWPTLVTEEDDRLAWVDFAGRRFAIVQTFDSGCGCYLWDASIVLLKYFEHVNKRCDFTGMRVVELGAGCGLVGLALAWLGAEVCLTDLYDQIDVMEANIDRNFGYRTSRSQEESEGSPLVRPVNIRAGELDWSASAEDINEEYNPPVDLIVGSDIIYAEEAVPLLINALNILSSPKTNILIAHEGRSKDIDAKFEELAAQHFDIEVLDWDEFDPVYRCDEICIIKLQKKSS